MQNARRARAMARVNPGRSKPQRLFPGFRPLRGLNPGYRAQRSHVRSVTPRARSLCFCTLPLSVLGVSLTN